MEEPLGQLKFEAYDFGYGYCNILCNNEKQIFIMKPMKYLKYW